MTLKCVRFISEETCFFRGLLPICCSHFHGSSFPLVTFFPSSFQPLLLLILCYMVLSCRYYCCLEGLRNCMGNENILIFLCLEHTSPLEILFLNINSFVSFYTWCIFVPVPMLTYFLCSECILLKLDSNVTSISSCFRRVKFLSLMFVSSEQSVMSEECFTVLIKSGRIFCTLSQMSTNQASVEMYWDNFYIYCRVFTVNSVWFCCLPRCFVICISTMPGVWVPHIRMFVFAVKTEFKASFTLQDTLLHSCFTETVCSQPHVT